MNRTDLQTRPEEEVAEIEKHKYFLSEKAGYDIGWEHAQQDWDENHAETFRQSKQPAGAAGVGTLLKRVLASVRPR